MKIPQWTGEKSSVRAVIVRQTRTMALKKAGRAFAQPWIEVIQNNLVFKPDHVKSERFQLGLAGAQGVDPIAAGQDSR